MNQELREALDDADKWYELYLGQKFANERLVKEINTANANPNRNRTSQVYGYNGTRVQ